MNYRLISLDLDGTLLNSARLVSPRTRAALQQVRARGVLTVIATGRTAPSAQHFSRQIGSDPIICCNGALVIDGTGELIVSKPIPLAPLTRLLLLC